ncbi:uncharacterized protein SPPG_07617 [Spizellomyces punctatus DAOM BR117]|uniref:Uncharacterized protein n=1 Tax=Spizellomyces punctatus (strain DAOM BR117) TaxID=645134 RepID=A0A0L0H6U5_SPIPD|nr:uncharacterized protein SPPG_07617 [Spizellomyces punctatus DAOM BR117]KNC97230.1 hypothetical protein SPPG_07617 [Spizellomyces punctatus DAOM BR117]|eukprot:XP_016605270.1 hypothetical protein SPPG_07617 [Spizellomyces punctatus DAOM BR117]
MAAEHEERELEVAETQVHHGDGSPLVEIVPLPAESGNDESAESKDQSSARHVVEEQENAVEKGTSETVNIETGNEEPYPSDSIPVATDDIVHEYDLINSVVLTDRTEHVESNLDFVTTKENIRTDDETVPADALVDDRDSSGEPHPKVMSDTNVDDRTVDMAGSVNSVFTDRVHEYEVVDTPELGGTPDLVEAVSKSPSPVCVGELKSHQTGPSTSPDVHAAADILEEFIAGTPTENLNELLEGLAENTKSTKSTEHVDPVPDANVIQERDLHIQPEENPTSIPVERSSEVEDITPSAVVASVEEITMDGSDPAYADITALPLVSNVLSEGNTVDLTESVTEVKQDIADDVPADSSANGETLADVINVVEIENKSQSSEGAIAGEPAVGDPPVASAAEEQSSDTFQIKDTPVEQEDHTGNKQSFEKIVATEEPKTNAIEVPRAEIQEEVKEEPKPQSQKEEPKEDQKPVQEPITSPVIHPTPPQTPPPKPAHLFSDYRRVSRSLERLVSAASSPAPSPIARTAAHGEVLPVSAITAAVRATNPILDELLYSLNLIQNNDESLVDLDLTDCPVFRIVHGTALAGGLLKNTHLKKVALKGVGFQTQNAIELAEALKHNTTLEVLDLSNNQIAPAGIKALAEMLQENQGLKELRLSQQRAPAGTDAEQSLARALAKNETLTRLSLQIRDVASRNAIDRSITRNKEIARKKRWAAQQA